MFPYILNIFFKTSGQNDLIKYVILRDKKKFSYFFIIFIVLTKQEIVNEATMGSERDSRYEAITAMADNRVPSFFETRYGRCVSKKITTRGVSLVLSTQIT